MWILFPFMSLYIGFLYLMFYSPVSSNGYQPSDSVNTQICNDNIFSNTQPPTVDNEAPSSVAFYSNDVLMLDCNIDGKPPPVYEWYISTNKRMHNPIVIQDQTYDKIPSANYRVLQIDGKSTKETYFKHAYYCSAKNTLGVLLNNKIVVQKVTRPSSIVIKYISHSIFEGEKFMAQCYLEPDLGPLYQFLHWEIRLRPEEVTVVKETVGRYSVIRSTKLPQLHIRNVTKDEFNRTMFRCIFRSNIYNSDEVVQSFFKAIERFSGEDIPHYRELRCNGETLMAAVGSNIELPWCSVPRTLKVSWYKIDNVDSKKKIEIGNKINDTKFVFVSRHYGNLMIMNVTKEDAGSYLAESPIRQLETTFTLNVYDVPSITLSPRKSCKKLSETATFQCNATFSESQFRWLHNGVKVIDGYDDGNIEVVSTVNGSQLTVKNVRLSATGVYQCIAISVAVSKGPEDYKQTSASLFLTDLPPTLINQSPPVKRDAYTAQLKMSKTDGIATIECVFAANPTPSINWYQDSGKVPITKVIKMSIEPDQNSIYNFVTKLTINLDEMDKDDDILKYAGEYQARAANSLGSTSCNTFILIDGVAQIRLPKKQTAVGGNDHLMSCFFVSFEVPQFFWERKIDRSEVWETLPVNHRTRLIDKGHKLLLKKVIKTEDEGIYRCTIKTNKEDKSSTTRLTVAYPPILQHLPTKHDSSQSQTHICTISSAADKPWYAWWTFTKYNTNHTKIISPLIKDPLFSVYYNQAPSFSEHLLPGIPSFLSNYPNVGVDLVVKARSHDSEAFGTFVCNAKNHVGFDEKSIKDNFLTLEFKIAPPSSSEVVVGDNLYLDCTAAESDLNPVVKWRLLKEDGKYVNVNDIKHEYNNRIHQCNNGTIVMTHIKESDPSKLTCFIFPSSNSDKVQSRISYIEIRVPARLDRLEKEIVKVSGTSFNLSCNVYGHTQNMVVTWFFRPNDNQQWATLFEACIYSNENQCLSQYQSNSEKFTQIIQTHNRTFHTVNLEFRNALESISGNYKCEARNKFNVEVARTSTTLTIISKPSKVIIDSSQKDATSTSVSFEWKPPEHNGNRPILRYVVTYSEMSSLTNRDDQKNATTKTIRVNSTVLSLVIDQLRPFKKYRVDIAAENEVGVSEPFTIYLTTQEAKPQKSVNNLMAISTKPDEILISWSDPDPEYQNGVINRYQVCYQVLPTTDESKSLLAFDRLNWPDSSANNPNQFENVKCQDTDKKMFVVSNLPQFTDFVIQVVAFNKKGASPSLFTKVRTLEDLPQAAPIHVICEGNHQAIRLTWNPPARQSINGVLIGYVVYYYQPNMYRDESDMKGISVHGKTNVVIDQLKPYTTYSIQIMAVNRKGLGPPSSSVVCATKEAKPEAPEMVKAIKINITCVVASWLHTPNPNGIIKQYCVTSLGFNYRIEKCQPPDMNKRYNTRIICDHYRRVTNVQVYARNQYDGVVKEASLNEDLNGIISIGGDINVNEGSSIVLPCETASSAYSNIYWKKDSQEINNNEFPNLKILKNYSLEISSITKYGRHSYSCYTETDNIEYMLIVKESPDGIPRTPIIDDFRVTENSIFFRWKSRGTGNMAVPITGFIINWQNLYTSDSKTVILDENARSFYLNNVTCASDVLVKVSAHSGNGKSKFSEPKRLRSLGSAPLIADSTILLPSENIDAHGANFNLLAFLPGDNCSATFFTIELSLALMGIREFSDLIFHKNISIYELENKCCYKVTGLNPITTYNYRITAYNPAGSVQSSNCLQTLAINGGHPGIRQIGTSSNTIGGQFLILVIILIFVTIAVLIVVVVVVLYIVRSKEKKSQSGTIKVKNRKSDYNQNRVEKPGKEDTASIGSDPSPYAVYQPETDPKGGHLWSQQVSQKSTATPLYNYTDHLYNHIRDDKIQGRYLDNCRRANSAECLSSVGNASVTGIADLEVPSNLETQDYFRAPFTQCADSDEVFQDLRYPVFNTINQKRIRRQSENLNRHNEEEKVRLMKNPNNQMAINRNRHYEPSNSRVQQQQVQQMYPLTGNSHRHQYRQQMSVPEPVAKYHQQYGYPSNRIRSSSGSGQAHPTSQNSNIPGSSSQVSGYGSYYGHRIPNIQPYASSSGIRRDNEVPMNQYPSFVASNGTSVYNPPQKSVVKKTAPESTESPDEGIYTDRVIVV